MSRKLLILSVVGLLSIVADQVSKYLAVAHLTNGFRQSSVVDRLLTFLTPERPVRAVREVHVIEDFWHFRYIENPGAAWGLFANLPDPFRTPFFLVVTGAAMAFIVWMYRRVPARETFLLVALALVFGGAIGNFIDRLSRGYVIDFIDWHWQGRADLRWPTFNIADAAISVGVAMMVLDALRVWVRRRAARAETGRVTPAPPPHIAIGDGERPPL